MLSLRCEFSSFKCFQHLALPLRHRCGRINAGNMTATSPSLVAHRLCYRCRIFRLRHCERAPVRTMFTPTAEPLTLLGPVGRARVSLSSAKKKHTSYVFVRAGVFCASTHGIRVRPRARVRASTRVTLFGRRTNATVTACAAPVACTYVCARPLVTLQSTAMSQTRSWAAARAVRPQAVRAR